MRSTTKERFKANSAVGMPCSLRRERSLRSATSTWSTKGLLLLVCFLSTAEAAGLWGLGSKNAAQRGVSRQSAISDDDSMDEVFAKLQQEQFWAEVEHAGMQVLEEEVAEKKSKEIFVQVAKACSIGAQMTLIMGGGALLFRLLPVLLGHELEDEEEVDAASTYLLQADHSRGRAQQALPAAAAGGGAGGGRQRLLTGGHEELEEDVAVRLEGQAECCGEAGGSGAADVGELAEGGDGAALMKSGGSAGAVVAAEHGEGEEEEEVGDGEVVMDTPRRAALRKARRLSRPFLRAMAPPLALLLVARLALGKLMVERIDPTLELLFGDDIIDLYSVNRKVVNKVDMPFPKDAEDVPGRKKMKGRSVQRLPRPEGEEEEEGRDRENEEGESLL